MAKEIVVAMALACMAAMAGEPAALPLVADAEFEDLRGQCQRIMQSLEEMKSPLPADTAKALQLLVRDGSKDPVNSVEKMQKLLDASCLIGVSINPESRVKAARGAAAADLRLGRTVVVLIKVHNEAGVTHPLKIASPQMRSPGRANAGAWLEAEVVARPPLPKKLTGKKLEYMLLQITAHEAGKREATLKFDVGQGTQDLGFRAEVPVLFTVKRR